MSSEAKGVHGMMKTHCGNQAVYVHCAAHALNLTLMKASEVAQIRNAFGTICSVANFFNSSTVRSGRLQKALDDTETTHSKRSLKAPCQTRWVEKHEAVHTLYDLFEPVAIVLGEMSDERGTASRDASALLTSISHTEFVVSLCILNEVMTLTKQLSIALQSSSTSLVEALSYKDKVNVQLDTWRKDDSKFLGMVAKAKKLLNTDELSVPRVVGRQTKRSNVPHTGPTDYYRKNVYFPFMDCLLSQFKDRFQAHDKVAKPLSSLLPKSVQTAKFSDFHSSIELYKHLLPGNNTAIEIEFESWQIHCQEENLTTNDCLAALGTCPKAFYPNVNVLLSIYATLPVSTATPERTFSALKQIKTYLRSTMSEERLNGLALAYIHKELDIPRVVTEMVYPEKLEETVVNFVWPIAVVYYFKERADIQDSWDLSCEVTVIDSCRGSDFDAISWFLPSHFGTAGLRQHRVATKGRYMFFQIANISNANHGVKGYRLGEGVVLEVNTESELLMAKPLSRKEMKNVKFRVEGKKTIESWNISCWCKYEGKEQFIGTVKQSLDIGHPLCYNKIYSVLSSVCPGQSCVEYFNPKLNGRPIYDAEIKTNFKNDKYTLGAQRGSKGVILWNTENTSDGGMAFAKKMRNLTEELTDGTSFKLPNNE